MPENDLRGLIGYAKRQCTPDMKEAVISLIKTNVNANRIYILITLERYATNVGFASQY